MTMLLHIYQILKIIHDGKILWFSQIDQSSKNFSGEMTCAIGFGYIRLTSNCESFPVSYSLNSAYSQSFHFKKFAMYGNNKSD